MPIRLMLPEDRDAILSIDPVIFPHEERFTAGEFDTYFERGFSFVFFDEETKEINGYIIAKSFPHPEQLFIGNIGVLPEKARQGIGTQLMSAVIRAAEKTNECKTIRLQVRKDNIKAIKLYEKLKFNIVSFSGLEHQYMQREVSHKLQDSPLPDVEPNPTVQPQIHGIQATQAEIDRLEKNAKSCFGIKNTAKAARVTEALSAAIKLQDSPLPDVESNPTVQPQIHGIQAIQAEIDRLEKNAKSCFGIKNTAKAARVTEALSAAIARGVNDVRKDPLVRAALANHRIFSFFGTKKTQGIINVDRNLLLIP